MQFVGTTVRTITPAWLAAILVVSGCAYPPTVESALTESEQRFGNHRDDVYARAGTRFSNADFYKPRGRLPKPFTISLAPLIVQQLPTADPQQPRPHRFGTLRTDSGGVLSVDTDSPAVYAATATAMLHGVPHDQLIFVWFYPPDSAAGSPTAQGVRMTLDTAGFPVLWEVLADHTRTNLIYVARSLENAALERFGPPHPGRRFAVERPVTERPNVFVARLLDDGPVPMGPFVYLDARRRAVTTLLCRCMPSQMDNIVESEYYDLLPLDELIERGFDPETLQPATAFAIDGSDHPTSLQRSLRLPDIP